ncbi:MAG: hypothetical protein QOJ25_369 [Solirubrobacteraceae bacterium]|jgi:uncharacterized membrane protein HdeD (DUF308 family)|nr:hypothetical protein [Solirubrobacteraceae bacterium]
MREPGGIYRSSTRVMSLIMVVIGVVLLVRTLTLGGGPTAIGLILGVGFIAAGAGRLYLASRSR